MHTNTIRSVRMAGIAKWIAVLVLAVSSENPVLAQSDDPYHVTIPQSGVPLAPVPSAPVPTTLPSVAAQMMDLSGVWTTQTGATFYVRQIGSQIWWYGTQSPTKPRWTNVASGQLDGNVVRVHWVDVPQGMTASSGDLALTAIDNHHLVISENPNNFLSADWLR